MSSIPPTLQAFWSSPLVATQAFGVLQGWADVVHSPLPVAVQPPKPASHISAAVRRILLKPPPATGLDAIQESLEVLQDRREYCGTLLRLSADKIFEALTVPAGQSEVLRPLSDWLPDVERILNFYNLDLLTFRNHLAEAERQQRLPTDAVNWMLQVAERLYTRLYRAHAQIRTAAELAEGRLDAPSANEIRRRLSWVLTLREFERPVGWDDLPALEAAKLPVGSLKDRFETGMVLLHHFRRDLSEREIALYERAAQSDVRGYDIAFDLDKTLGDTRDRSSAMTEMGRLPERYDVVHGDFAHQFTRVRIPYRGMQAVLLGLWAAGNRLRLYTASDNMPDSHECFFNDFPLVKVAFGLAIPSNPCETLTRADLHASGRYMDGIKRKEFTAKYFGTKDGRHFLQKLREESGMKNLDHLKDSKIPFPTFPFDVLVDDLDYFAGEMQAVGFGRRWIEAPPDASEMLTRLETYFSKPLEGVSDTIRDWLNSWEIS